MDLIQCLNPQQKEAVLHTEGPLLVLAGPVSYYQKEVDALNQKRREEGVKKISSKSPLLYLGYFPLKGIIDKLKVKKWVDYFKLTKKKRRTIKFTVHRISRSKRWVAPQRCPIYAAS